MIKAEAVVRASPKYLGVPYSRLDCQAFVEACLKDAGLNRNLPGSNAWYRECKAHGWVGSPEECKKKYGEIPHGAFLFILSNNGNEPARYKGDGIGNASHIGLYTGLSGGEMVDLAEQAGNRNNPYDCNYGSGAVHSSSSRGKVCTSKFEGKTISDGWNQVGLYDQIDYWKGGKHMPETDFATVVLPTGASGTTVNLRTSQSRNAVLVERIPVGATVTVLEDSGKWCRISYNGKTGWMMSNYLEYSGQDGESGGDVVTTAERLQIETALCEIEKQIEMIRSTLGRG